MAAQSESEPVDVETQPDAVPTDEKSTEIKNGEGECDDCGRWTKLICVPGCADYEYDGSLCCKKYICADHCIYKCQNGHENTSSDCNGWVYELSCLVCTTKWTPKFTWWGIDPNEWKRRYG